MNDQKGINQPKEDPETNPSLVPVFMGEKGWFKG